MAQLPILSRRDNICGKDDKAVQCAKPAESNSITIPVVLAVVYVLSSKMMSLMMADLWSRIPVASALVLFFYLHRRHVRKQRQEDANDPHKSLDFGMTMANAGANKKGHSAVAETPELGTEKSSRRDRYVSMDMGPGSPYILPPGLQGSRESLHSLSRNMDTTDNPYRPATSHASPDSPHSYLRSRGFGDDSSSLSSGRYANENMNQNLLGNAQGMSRTTPPSGHSPPQGNPVVPAIRTPETQPARKPLTTSDAGPGLSAPVQLDPRDSYMSKDIADIRKSNNYLGPLIHSRETSADLHPQSPDTASSNTPAVSTSPPTLQNSSRKSPPPKIITTSAPSRPPRLQSLKAPAAPIYEEKSLDDSNDYGDTFKITPPLPRKPPMPPKSNIGHNPGRERMPLEDDYTTRELHAPPGVHDSRRMSTGVRPLPPDDPTDNPEQRANRIRSFYKEYFDDSKAASSAPSGAYVEDYDQIYPGDKGDYIAAQPQFAVPYARRAMTPPPRAPPRFQGAARHQQTFSGSGRSMTPGPRPFSPASGRQFGPSGRGSPRPNQPPPSPLRILPTPHLMKEDSFALPIDFAPPTSYKDRAAGRPESPLGGLRPYSPMVPAHLPLASSFDDLSVMPSP